MTPEGKVKADIKAFLSSLGSDCWYFMPMMMGYGRRGIPDFVGCFNGFFFAIEAKAPGELHDVKPWQAAELRGIAGAKGAAMVVDSVESIKQMFKMVDRDAVFKGV